MQGSELLRELGHAKWGVCGAPYGPHLTFRNPPPSLRGRGQTWPIRDFLRQGHTVPQYLVDAAMQHRQPPDAASIFFPPSPAPLRARSSHHDTSTLKRPHGRLDDVLASRCLSGLPRVGPRSCQSDGVLRPIAARRAPGPRKRSPFSALRNRINADQSPRPRSPPLHYVTSDATGPPSSAKSAPAQVLVIPRCSRLPPRTTVPRPGVESSSFPLQMPKHPPATSVYGPLAPQPATWPYGANEPNFADRLSRSRAPR